MEDSITGNSLPADLKESKSMQRCLRKNRNVLYKSGIMTIRGVRRSNYSCFADLNRKATRRLVVKGLFIIAQIVFGTLWIVILELLNQYLLLNLT